MCEEQANLLFYAKVRKKMPVLTLFCPAWMQSIPFEGIYENDNRFVNYPVAGVFMQCFGSVYYLM